MHCEEFLWIRGLIRKYQFSLKELDILQSKFNSPSFAHKEYFKSIKNYYVRARVLEFTRYLFQVDGELCENEKRVYLELNTIHLSLSEGITELERNAAKAIIEVLKSQQLYKEIEMFGNYLNRRYPFGNMLDPAVSLMNSGVAAGACAADAYKKAQQCVSMC